MNKLSDPEIYSLLKREESRQFRGLELIASENFTSQKVLDTLGTVFTNKYAEGTPGKRYYGGTDVVDDLERLCVKRALKAFRLDSSKWGVNTQPYSGSTANLAVFMAVLKPHDRFMGLDLPSGGHLSHGAYTGHKKINISSMFWDNLPYSVDKTTGRIDYDEVEKLALRYSPKLLIAGSSAYPRDWDYRRMRSIADKVNAVFMVDMAHFAGLVASELLQNPFDYAHPIWS